MGSHGDAGTEVGDSCYNVPPFPWTVVCVILGYFSTGVSCLTLIKGQPGREEEEKEELEGQRQRPGFQESVHSGVPTVDRSSLRSEGRGMPWGPSD